VLVFVRTKKLFDSGGRSKKVRDFPFFRRQNTRYKGRKYIFLKKGISLFEILSGGVSLWWGVLVHRGGPRFVASFGGLFLAKNGQNGLLRFSVKIRSLTWGKTVFSGAAKKRKKLSLTFPA
jgi:hypothetical protein